MLFHDLDEDVLAQILLLCDIYAVLSFLQVNRSFHRLALSKQLWISLVRDLSARYLLPHLDALDDCTTAQLITKVKTLMCGPETWLPQSSVPPTVSFSKTFAAGAEARLLPGGRYLAVSSGFGELHCHDVSTGREISLGAARSNHTTSWEVDMLDDGYTANFAFLKKFIGVKRPEISIVQVNLRTGHSDQLFRLELNRDGGLYYSPVIFGDFLAMKLSKKNQRMFVVINWRQQKYAVFEDSSKSEGSMSRVAIVPGHIILTTVASKRPNDQLLLVYALGSMASCWRPVEELLYKTDPLTHELRIRPENTQPFIVERLKHNNRVFIAASSRIGMTLHPNPIRHNAYKLIVHASDFDGSATNTSHGTLLNHSGGSGSPQGTVLFIYMINLDSSTNSGFSWTRTSAFSTAPDVLYSSFSYAVYAVVSTPNNSDTHGTTTMIIDPVPTQRWTKWAGQMTREVMVLSKGFTAASTSSISSTGVILISKLNGIEICWYA
ncbi:hypothetical protein MSAN_01314500 [Mycena sanguinolenta]|uniref:F-box domain-containing protein n=1 Tax=Mycena sanguinolenta TaxID=230812 RepID=A0A8H6YDK2_9AGAR|nr:hypothetical protein MSAN_01314500 [Mycena sanguinolenta]